MPISADDRVFFPHAPTLYARSRPNYPVALFAFLAAQPRESRLAWDCACGNGQAAAGLRHHFGRVVATDANLGQLELAVREPRIRYAVAAAEFAPLAAHSVDLITVGQALHWLDLTRFWQEVLRTLAPGGCIAYWFYDPGRLRTVSSLERVIGTFYAQDLAPHLPQAWHELNQPASRFPMSLIPLSAPDFELTADWTRGQLNHYLASLGSIRLHYQVIGDDPLPRLLEAVRNAWPANQAVVEIRWPLRLHCAVRSS